jgi:hypothetical protein
VRAAEAIVVVLLLAGLACAAIAWAEGRRRRRRWGIQPHAVDATHDAVFLQRPGERIQVGPPFARGDEAAFQEHVLDAKRMRKDMAGTD